MTHEEKIKYMRIAAGICCYHFDHKGLDMLVSLYEQVIEKKGDTDIRSLSKIETEVHERHKPKLPESTS